MEREYSGCAVSQVWYTGDRSQWVQIEEIGMFVLEIQFEGSMISLSSVTHDCRRLRHRPPYQDGQEVAVNGGLQIVRFMLNKRPEKRRCGRQLNRRLELRLDWLIGPFNRGLHALHHTSLRHQVHHTRHCFGFDKRSPGSQSMPSISCQIEKRQYVVHGNTTAFQPPPILTTNTSTFTPKRLRWNLTGFV